MSEVSRSSRSAVRSSGSYPHSSINIHSSEHLLLSSIANRETVTVSLPRTEPGNALIALRKRARRTASRSLVTLECAGLAAALAIWIWAPGRWRLALPFLALSSFGLWGVTDRLISANRRRMDPLVEAALRSLRLAIAVAGTACAAAALYLALGKAIGSL